MNDLLREIFEEVLKKDKAYLSIESNDYLYVETKEISDAFNLRKSSTNELQTLLNRLRKSKQTIIKHPKTEALYINGKLIKEAPVIVFDLSDPEIDVISIKECAYFDKYNCLPDDMRLLFEKKAIQYLREENIDKVINFFDGSNQLRYNVIDKEWLISRPDGYKKQLNYGDYIVKTDSGAFYACTSDEFKKEY